MTLSELGVRRPVLAVVTAIALLVFVVNLATDALFRVLDPRLRGSP